MSIKGLFYFFKPLVFGTKTSCCIYSLSTLEFLQQFKALFSNLDSLLVSGVTTATDWLLLRKAPSPWAELEFDNIILTVPSEVVRDLEGIDDLAALWNDIMRAVADLAAIPRKFTRKERIVADVQISHGKCVLPSHTHKFS